MGIFNLKTKKGNEEKKGNEGKGKETGKEKETGTVEIKEKSQETEPEESPKISEEDLGNLSEKEREMAVKQGLVEKEGKDSDKEKEGKEGSDKDTETDKKKDSEKKKGEKGEEGEEGEEGELSDEEIAKKARDDDLTDKEAQEFGQKLDKKKAGLFFDMRNERKKRQEAQRKYEQLKIKQAAEQEKETDKTTKEGQARIDEINEEIKDFYSQDEDTVVALKDLKHIEELRQERAKISSKIDKSQDSTKKQQAQRITQKLDEVNIKEAKKCEKNGDSWNYYVNLARDMMEKDEFYRRSMLIALANVEEDPEKPIQTTYKVARMHPDYVNDKEKHLTDKKRRETGEEEEEDETGKTKKKTGKNKEETKEKIDRIVTNSKKKTTSGQVGSGGDETRSVSFDDLTVEDVAGMSKREYGQLPGHVRQRLLREADKKA